MKQEENKVYQVIFQDNYNNLFDFGFYTNLRDVVDELNDSVLKDCKYKLKYDDVKEYPSTFNYCFDACLGDIFSQYDENVYDDVDVSDYCDSYIRGFIWEKDFIKDMIGKL